MNRLLLIIATTFASSAFAQGWGDWGGGGGASSSSSAQSTSGKKSTTSASVSVGSSTKGGKGTSVSAAATVTTPAEPAAEAQAAPTMNIPTIGTHYDDSAVAHFEPEYVSQDSNLGWKQGEYIPRPYLRNADIKMRKRVWRVIDLRQKLNKSWTWPRNPVSQVFWELGTKGLVRAYATDSLNTVITPETIIKITSKMESAPVLNVGVDPALADPDADYHDSTFPVYFKWEYITKFEIMEDWVFDYKHGDWRPIIIAIAPIQERKEAIKGPDGNDITITIPFKPFWLRMDDCRPTLAKSAVFNRYNDAMRLTWDQHINGHRLFDSYIVKTTDWDDRYLDSKPEYKEDNIALLLESDKLKNDLFIFEHDLWEY